MRCAHEDSLHLKTDEMHVIASAKLLYTTHFCLCATVPCRVLSAVTCNGSHLVLPLPYVGSGRICGVEDVFCRARRLLCFRLLAVRSWQYKAVAVSTLQPT